MELSKKVEELIVVVGIEERLNPRYLEGIV